MHMPANPRPHPGAAPQQDGGQVQPAAFEQQACGTAARAPCAGAAAARMNSVAWGFPPMFAAPPDTLSTLVHQGPKQPHPQPRHSSNPHKATPHSTPHPPRCRARFTAWRRRPSARDRPRMRLVLCPFLWAAAACCSCSLSLFSPCTQSHDTPPPAPTASRPPFFWRRSSGLTQKGSKRAVEAAPRGATPRRRLGNKTPAPCLLRRRPAADALAGSRAPPCPRTRGFVFCTLCRTRPPCTSIFLVAHSVKAPTFS